MLLIVFQYHFIICLINLQVVAAAQNKTRYCVPTTSRTGVLRPAATASLRQKLHLTTTAPAKVDKPVRIVSTPRARSVCSSLYDSVLPLIHKKSDTRPSSVFSGYVPKGKQVVNVQQQAQEEIRRPKVVCFSLPVTVDCSVQRDTISNSQLNVPVADPRTSPIISETKCNVGPAQVNEGNIGSSVLFTAVPTSSNELVVSSAVKVKSSSEVVDDWLCDEIFASESFKSNGLYPENMLDETQFLFENNSVAALVSSIISPTVDSSKCDILNGDSGFPKSNLILPEPISQFTFDDMLSYLYN